MANELNVTNSTGQTMYCIVVSGAMFLNGTTLEAYNAAHWTNYAISLTDPHTIGMYSGTMPLASAGNYSPNYYRQASGSPATTDAPALAVEPNGPLFWSGTAFVNNDTNSSATLSLLLNMTVPAQTGTNNQFTAHALALGPTGNEGVGPYVVTQQVTDGTSSIQSVLVGLSINNTNYSALTGADGIATFGLNATGVYLESAAPTIGMYENYTPTTQTISGSTTLSVIVLVPSAPPIPGVGQCIGTLVCVNAHGARESGVTVWFQAANVPNEAEGVDYDSTIFVETSGSFGVISTLFPSGSVPYQHWRGNSSTATGPKTSFTTAANDGDTFDIPDGIGSP